MCKKCSNKEPMVDINNLLELNQSAPEAQPVAPTSLAEALHDCAKQLLNEYISENLFDVNDAEQYDIGAWGATSYKGMEFDVNVWHNGRAWQAGAYLVFDSVMDTSTWINIDVNVNN